MQLIFNLCGKAWDYRNPDSIYAKGGAETGGYHCCDFFGNAKEFIDTYNRICAEGDNADYFTVCIDTGHSNKAIRFDNPSAGDVIRMHRLERCA